MLRGPALGRFVGFVWLALFGVLEDGTQHDLVLRYVLFPWLNLLMNIVHIFSRFLSKSNMNTGQFAGKLQT